LFRIYDRDNYSLYHSLQSSKKNNKSGSHLQHNTIMGRKKTNRKTMSIRVHEENEAELKEIVKKADKELIVKKQNKSS